MSEFSSRLKWTIRIIGILFVLFIIIAVLFPATPFFGYAYHRVDTTQIGIKIDSGEFDTVLCAGTYTDMFDSYADIQNVNVTGLPFEGTFQEVLTDDMQRIGVVVSGIAFPPGCGEMTEELWIAYSRIYRSDNLLRDEVNKQSQQATKVCVGDRTFESAAVGSSRDDLRECIIEEITLNLAAYGITVANLVVPDIIISPQVQDQLDALTASRNDTLLARQDEEKLRAQAQRDLAQQQGAIMVEEGITQERFRQDAISADLERQANEADMAVIESDNANNILEAQGALAVAEIELQTAEVNAQADLADEMQLAAIIQDSPLYAEYLRYVQLAQSLVGIDKIIVPAGTNPILMFDDAAEGVTPTVDVTPVEPQQ